MDTDGLHNHIWMRLVLDYGGTLVTSVDESQYSKALSGEDSFPMGGYIAYKAFSLGIIESEERYLELLSMLTGASIEECKDYLADRRRAPEFPEEHRRVLERLAHDHSLVLFTDQVRPWIRRDLKRLEIEELFDDVIVSSDLGDEKPHPRGYARAEAGYDDVMMVSDELNDDLLMADYFDMTTVWIKLSNEEIHFEPDYLIDDFVQVEEVIQKHLEER
ncbi:MAG: HAD family hydrolase [Halobacteria archaeon]